MRGERGPTVFGPVQVLDRLIVFYLWQRSALYGADLSTSIGQLPASCNSHSNGHVSNPALARM